MSTFTVSRTIDAPLERVFQTIADIRNFSRAVPDIVDVEFLTDAKSGVGTRFRETRIMKGKRASTELEVTEYEPNHRVRIVSDTHGTLWDTVFTVKPVEDKVLLELVMDAKAYKLLPKMMNPMMKGMLEKALEKDMDAVKTYCER